MRKICRALLSFTSCLVLLSACATSITPSPEVIKTDTTTWKTDSFVIHFTAGDRPDGEKHTTSIYEILSRTGKGRLIAQSAHSTYGFESLAEFDVSYIKIIPDSNGTDLLIEEVIPNDCSPCSNFIWVRQSESSKLVHSYLQFPTSPQSEATAYDFEHYPTILSLSDGTVQLRLPNGNIKTTDVGKLESRNEPTPPG